MNQIKVFLRNYFIGNIFALKSEKVSKVAKGLFFETTHAFLTWLLIPRQQMPLYVIFLTVLILTIFCLFTVTFSTSD